MLRAGPLSDQRIIRLANRRFVPFHFDLFAGGFLSDADAKQFVKENLPEYAGNAVATPPVILLTPGGEIVQQVSNYASTEELLTVMLAVLQQHPEFNAESNEEKSLTRPMDRAQLYIDLVQLDKARVLLQQLGTAEAQLVLARLARQEENWEEMESRLQQVDATGMVDDVRLERAHRMLRQGQFSQLLEALKEFPRDHPRYTEARYLTGLAHFHLDQPEAARAVWKSTVQSCAQDPWIYRADWAYTETLQGNQQVLRAGGQTPSLLGRIGYMGVENPDLKKRRDAGDGR